MDTPDPDWGLRPQSAIFALLAEHLLDHEQAVFAGSFIEVLGRLAIGEHATRAALARMTRRGHLAKERIGRKTYFRMTPRCIDILEDGRKRMWLTGAVNRDRNTSWTLLMFSLPESWQRKRYDLRARLVWAGFGLLQNGVWLSPATVDVTPIVQELGLGQHVRVFHGRAARPTDPGAVLADTFDLGAVRARYDGFIARWSAGMPDAPDALALTLHLSTHWLHIIKDDPRVPLDLLPSGWPAVRAQELFQSLHRQHHAAARRLAATELDTVA